ncbi:MAG TPA: glycine betaine ABC transporter substrate-binding protein [Thermoleophilaceae bacterium]|nr:glycine betaine ABC transporter substrate-binding protein [Thermoleophilaceae bacterium]
MLALVAALALALTATACGDDDSDSGSSSDSGGGDSAKLIKDDPANAKKKTIVVGSKNFDEQYILGEIYAQALEAAGFKVEKKLNLGSEQIAYKALKSGQVDMYPEYTGTSLTSFFDVKTDDVPKEPDAAYELAKKDYAKEGIVAMPRTSFENTFRIATTKAKQKELLDGKTTVSEVAKLPNASKLSIAGFPECEQRSDCLQGLKNTYDWTPKFVSDEGKYQPIDKDRSDLGFVFSTDGELTLGKYAIIDDDKNLFPPYNISLGVRDSTYKELGKEGQDVILKVQKPLNEKAMQELNSRVSLDKQEPEKVAAAYLKESGFTK